MAQMCDPGPAERGHKPMLLIHSKVRNRLGKGGVRKLVRMYHKGGEEVEREEDRPLREPRVGGPRAPSGIS